MKLKNLVLQAVMLIAISFSFCNPSIAFSGSDSGLAKMPPPTINPSGSVVFCGRGVLTVSGYPSNASFQWLNGNTAISGSNSTTQTITTTGTYYCVVIQGGNRDTTAGVSVTVYQADTVNISTSDNNICNGLNTTITATATIPGSTFSWTPSTTLNSSTATTVTATPTSTTQYTVIATAPAPNTCKDTARITITVNPKPTASFIFNPNSGCPRRRRKIYFTSTSTTNGSGNLNYAWNFGDPNSNNNTSNDNNPDHSFTGTGFSNTGSFTVTLIVTNTSTGCKDTATQTISIGQFPDATLIDTINEPDFATCNGGNSLDLTVTNASTTQAINSNYQINWGDNSTNFSSATLTSTTHTYPSIGYYTLTFIVTSNSGCKDSTDYRVFFGSNPGGSISSPSSTYGCTGQTFSFPFANVLGNTPGTEYLIYVNDGTDTVRYTQQTLPAVFTHTFDSSSCGTAPNNTFTVSYLIINPCGETPGTIGGIRISKKPEADFSISPKDTVCENTTVTFTNTGSLGQTVPTSGSGACTSGKQVWEITPATGWSLVAGTLGSAPNSNVPNWAIGTNSIQVNFTAPGNYNIKLKTGSSSCGIDDTVKTICVNPLPVAAFTISPDTVGCAPLIRTASATTNPSFCGRNTYRWTVTYTSTAGCSPNVIDYNYINNTSDTSTSPQFAFNNPGIYTIGLQAIAPASACSSQMVYHQVTVKGKPVVSFGNIPSVICTGTTFSPTSSASCYIDASTVFNWTFSNAVPSTSAQQIPGSVVINTAGSSAINLAVTNACGTTTASQSIVVNATPDVNTLANIIKCEGQNSGAINFSGSIPGTIFNWSNSNTAIGLSSSGSGNITTFVLTNNTGSSITSTITVTPTLNGCTGTPVSFTITVNPNPSISVNNAAVCSGNAVTLNASGADTYTWSPATGLSAVTGSSVNANPSASTNYTVVGTITATGCSSSAVAAVTVNNAAVIAGTKSDPNSCASATGSITISGLSPNTNYILNYSVGGSPHAPINFTTGNGITTYTLANLTAGVYSGITVTANGCTSNVLSFSLSDPNPPATPVLSNVSPICSGSTLNLSASTTSAGTVTWTWSGPNGFSSNVSNPTIPNASTAASGIYSVTATISGCTSQAGTVNVVVEQTPATPAASSNSPVCTGNALALSASTTSTMPVTWSWTGPNIFNSTQQNPQVSTNATTAMAGVYNVTATASYPTSNISCPSAAGITTVVVNTTPVISGSSSANPPNCASSSGSINLNGLSSNVTYEVHYTGPSGVITTNITSSSTGVITISSLPAGNYSNVYVVVNNCPSAAVGPFTLVDPTPPATPVLSNVSPICSGSTLNLSASTTSVGTVTWTWSGPNGFSSNVSNPSIPNASTSASGTYSVTATISGCTSQAGTVNVVVEQTPATPAASSNSPVCTGNAHTLNANTTSTMPVTWSWTGPNSFTSTQQNPQVSINATTSMAGVYNVTATATYAASNISCPSAAGSTTVVVNPTPAISSSSFTNPTNCATATGTILLNGLAASTSFEVHYTGPSGAGMVTLTSSATGTITIPNLNAGTYTNVYAVLTNCPSNAVGPFTLSDPTPPPTPNATNNSAICDGESLQLNATTTASGTPTWSWTGPNGFTSSLSNPVINPAGTNASGTYNVTITINNCTSTAGTTIVVVNPRPLAPVVTSPVVYCQYDTPLPLTATALPGHTLTWYSTATGGTGTSTAPTPSANATGTVSYYVSQTTPQSCEGPRAQIDVVVNPTPVIANQTDTECSGASFNIQPTGNGVNATTVYSWPAPVVTGGLTGGVSGLNASSIAGSLSNPTDFVQTATYTVTPKTGNCAGQPFTITLTINPAPRVNFSIPDQSLCSGSSSSVVQLTSPTPNVNIPWTATTPAGINGITSSGTNTIPSQTLVNNTASPIVVTYAAVAINSGTSGCPGDTSRYHININPKPFIHDTALVICSGQAFSLAPVNNQPYNIVPVNTTYTWQVGANSNVTGQSDTTNPVAVISQTLINHSNAPQQVSYTVTPYSGASGQCIGLPFTINVTVNPAPVFPNMHDTICSGQTFDTIPVNNPPFIVPAGTQYSWSVLQMPTGIGGQTSGGQAQSNQTHIYGTLVNTAYNPLDVIYSVVPSSSNSSGGACAGAAFNYIVTVNPLASINNNPLSQSVCNGYTTQPVTWTSFTTGSAYSWTVVSSGNVTGFLPAGNGPVLGAMTLSNNGIAQDSVVYAISSTASDCSGPATNYTIYVNPDAKAMISYPSDTACWPYAIVINNTSPRSAGNINIPNGSYDWYTVSPAGVPTFIGTGTNFPGYTIPDPSDSVTIRMVANSYFGCKKDSVQHTFHTRPQPSASFTLSNHDSCGPLTVSFVNHTLLLDTFQYQWSFGNGQTSTLSQPNPVTYLSNPRFYDTTYHIQLMAFNACDTSYYYDSVIVRADPKARFYVSSTSGCSPFTIQITNSSLGNAYDYYWDFDNGHLDTTHANGTFSYTYYTNVVDTFNLMLIAQSPCGRDTQIIKIRVAPNIIRPGISINATELYGCVAHDVTFINSTTGATSFTWDFGDLTPPVTTNLFQLTVPHNYSTAGTFNVTINLTNGCSDTVVYKQIIVYPKPVAAFQPDQSLICLGDTTHVTNTSQNATSYLWNWGNGPANSGFQPTHLYNTPGTFTIQLQAQVTAPTGVVCYDTVSHPITVLSKPDSTIITNLNLANCTPFVMNASAPGVINETVTWYVYDTTVAAYPIVLNGPTLQYTFNHPGTFTVHMMVENAAGCKDSTSRTFTVYQKPIAGFTPLNLSTCSLDTIVAYTNTTTANNYTPLTYQWFVDGVRMASSGNFSYHYVTSPAGTLPRTFNTKLVATNLVGCADSVTGILQMNPTSHAVFTLSNPNDCIPYVATITNNSTYATNYEWYLNGTFVSTAAAPQINITQSNTNYTLMLVTSNQYACRADTSRYSFRSRVMPKASFSINNNLGCTGQLNVVTNNTSTNATSYQWEWGDATPVMTATNPTHLYNTVGTYQIMLTASDGQCTDTTSKYVTVANKPVVNFYADQVIACDTATIHLVNLTSNADNYLWHISNGYTTTDPSPTVVLPPSNTLYSVTLVAYNTAGCKDSLTKANYIRSIIPPPADFHIDPAATISIPNYSFSFMNLVPNDPKYSYTWSLGDGSFANTRDVLDHQYPDTGSYEVKLIVLDNTTGCTDTVIKIARIEGYPGFLYVPNAFYPNSNQVKFRSFKPFGKGLAEYELQIFDSWGKLLFSTTKLDWAGSPVEGWDGTFKGQRMPQDAYAWKIKAKFRNGTEWSGMHYDNNENGSPGHNFGTLTLFR